jgi:pimeloyl-ACP methyl ester carboxylesterase
MAAPSPKRPLNPPTGNPLERTPYSPTTPVSQRTYPIAGIATTVLGLDELPKGCQNVSVIYLLHPRLQRAETMLPLGTLLVNSWNTRRAHLPPGHPSAELGLLCVTCDQRNHGGRLVNEVANGSWRDGNPRHAQDMYGSYAGTAADVSLLIDHLGSYVFEDFESHRYPEIVENYALGISLGGHACWHLLMREPRVRGAVVGIGCPDYIRK